MNQFQSWYYRQPPALRTILAINVVLYVIAQFAGLMPSVAYFMREHLALQPSFPDILFEPWQLVTYNFLHLGRGFGGLLHVGFNMLWLFWIGKEYEEMHGSHRLWALYLLTGVGGGVLCLILYPLVFGGGSVIIHGASASVLGVVMAVAILYPYKQIALIFIGVVRLLYVVIGFLVIDALLALSSSGVAVAAHWGGALAGFLYAKAERGGIDLTSWAARLFGDGSSSRRSRRPTPSSSGDAADGTGLLARLEAWLGGNDASDESTRRPRPTGASEESGDGRQSTPSDVEKEIDRILDKISEQGYDALSDEEKRILYEASQS